ncbi:Dabb family protein [Nocardia amamiensis]|uniref:Dabb family protein n=1 Tax=Nocardia amamiensis TaxID=404578 RepID=UPI00340C6045
MVMGWLRPDADPELFAKALRAYRSLSVSGVEMRITAGSDLRLRPDGASFACVTDLPDEQAYRAYEADEEHQRIRSELFAPITERIERVQFRMPETLSEIRARDPLGHNSVEQIGNREERL